MSNQTTYEQDDDEDVEEPQQQQEPNFVKQLRKDAKRSAKEAEELRTELTSIQRKSAFQEAGVPLNETQRLAAEAVHKGDWNGVAVRQTLVALGIAQPSEQEQEVVKALDGQERIAQASTGASATQTGAGALADAIKGAANEQEVLALLKAAGRTTTYDLQ